MYKKIKQCRICGNKQLVQVLDLGDQMLTGVFPRQLNAEVTVGPLRLVKCHDENGLDHCGLVQLEHSYDLDEMYGENYGYRSGLNKSMVEHLHNKVKKILSQISLTAQDIVVDIGSNDSTTLQAYPMGPALVGIDPTGVKFHTYYPEHISLIPDFFTADLFREHFPNKKAKVITSFSMFYDLDDPMGFMQQVYDVLDDEGIWVFEQSYMPTMLAMNSYDTACHEHLEYYSLRQIKWMADRVGFRIVDVEFNDINGGSFSVTTAKKNGQRVSATHVQQILDKECAEGLNTLLPYQEFASRVSALRSELIHFINTKKSEGKTISALGASTKGNVILQYCKLTSEQLDFVGEVNAEKFGSYTPGTWIPIIEEKELLAKKPDYLIVLPWHFRAFFEKQEKYKECKLVYPLPHLISESGKMASNKKQKIKA